MPTASLARMFAVAGGINSSIASLASLIGVGFKPPSLSNKSVPTECLDSVLKEGWTPTHIKLADEADLLLIAPATANILAKLAVGIADDALTCVALALNPRARILIAPAMNGKMWLHPATQQNAATLKSRAAEFIGPEEGLLSCGYEGLGRLWPVEAVARRAVEMVT